MPTDARRDPNDMGSPHPPALDAHQPQRPQYQVLPALSEEDFAALKADIAARGVLVPVEYDDDGNVLDGHHRLKACAELDIVEWPRVVRPRLSEGQKRQHARQLNLARRHLDRAQKRDLIAAQLRDTPQRSNRQIAEGLHVDHKTVQTVRAQSENRGEIPHVSKTVDKSGRSQAAKRPPKHPPGSRRFVPDAEFQAEAEAAARDLEIERDERIGLAGADGLVAENRKLTWQLALLDRRIAGLIAEIGSLKFREKMWRERALAAGWKGRADA
jgi:ParB-like chromosome segregation protein Spo0J